MEGCTSDESSSGWLTHREENLIVCLHGWKKERMKKRPLKTVDVFLPRLLRPRRRQHGAGGRNRVQSPYTDIAKYTSQNGSIVEQRQTNFATKSFFYFQFADCDFYGLGLPLEKWGGIVWGWLIIGLNKPIFSLGRQQGEKAKETSRTGRFIADEERYATTMPIFLAVPTFVYIMSAQRGKIHSGRKLIKAFFARVYLHISIIFIQLPNNLTKLRPRQFLAKDEGLLKRRWSLFMRDSFQKKLFPLSSFIHSIGAKQGRFLVRSVFVVRRRSNQESFPRTRAATSSFISKNFAFDIKLEDQGNKRRKKYI